MIQALKNLIKKIRQRARPAFYSGWQEGASLQSAVNQVSSWGISSGTASSLMYVDQFRMPGVPGSKPLEMEDKRIEKKPVDLVNFIVGTKPEIQLKDLDKQIKVVQRRLRLLEETGGNTRDERMALTFLSARQKFKKYGDLFRWQITTQELVEKLCKEYKVQAVNFAAYSRNVPNEALDQIEDYLNAWRKVVVRGEPNLRLIVDHGGKETKKDPILLAQSPFGSWYYILGAWDKEVEIVDDLVYHGK